MTAGPGYDLHAAIQKLPAQDGWKNVPLAENSDPLVPIGPFTDYPDLFTNSVYYGERTDSPYQADAGKQLNGALITLFLRESVAEKLRSTQRLLPPGHWLAVFDAYRPLEVQQALYDHYLDSLHTARPGLSEAELSAATQDYVSSPSTDPTRPPPHNTGGSVDLAIVRLTPSDGERVSEIDAELARLDYESDWSRFSHGSQDPYPKPGGASARGYLLEMERTLILRIRGELLDFGTPFDHGGPEAALRHYEEVSSPPRPIHRIAENQRNNERRRNRRLLCNAITAVGMVAYEHEWWHFSAPETQMGAKILGLSTARFGAQELGSTHRSFEHMRRSHHAGMIGQFERLRAGESHLPNDRSSDLVSTPELDRLALEKMLVHCAHPTTTSLPSAAVIAAP